MKVAGDFVKQSGFSTASTKFGIWQLSAANWAALSDALIQNILTLLCQQSNGHKK